MGQQFLYILIALLKIQKPPPPPTPTYDPLSFHLPPTNIFPLQGLIFSAACISNPALPLLMLLKFKNLKLYCRIAFIWKKYYIWFDIHVTISRTPCIHCMLHCML